MRVFLLFTVSLMGLLAGCASLEGSGAGGSHGQPSTVAVACTNSQVPTVVVPFDWELTVSLEEPIESGRPFAATLGGAIVLNEAFLDAAQQPLPEGFQRMDLVDLKATVHVRDGATGADVPLVPDPTRYNYECFRGGSACNPNNDVLDDPPDAPPGLRGNTDCEPVSQTNPCGRFINVPTSTDCLPEGECVRLGKIEQCIVHEFCVTADLRVDLQQESAEYTADAGGNVLFGWDDENTGAKIEEEGPNKGTWVLPEAVYLEPVPTIGLRMTIEGLPVAFDCTMGVDSQGPNGVGSLDPLSSPTPNELLISFPIE